MSTALKHFLVCVLVLSIHTALAGTLVQFHTPLGDIEVELYDQDKPVTVQNFLRYVRSGRYDNGFAHRLVPGFVFQGGGFAVTNRGTTNAAIVSIPTYPSITNEFDVGRRFSNVFGTIAMAKVGGDTNSATSQWFINLADNSSLDAADTNNLFVVFGHVIAGTNVLNRFNGFQYWNYPLSLAPANLTNLVAYYPNQLPFANLPLLHPSVTENSLIYVDVSLLDLGIQHDAGTGNEIFWTSAAGLTNVVEFTTNLPPVWSTLAVTNGTGERMTVIDPATAQHRFYRVRILR